MAWLVLIVSGMFETVWAVALSSSEGFKKPLPTIIFFVALAVSMGGLGWALKTLPVGTAYAVWVGVGAVLTVIYSMITGVESVSALKIVFIVGIVISVMGLNIVGSGH